MLTSILYRECYWPIVLYKHLKVRFRNIHIRCLLSYSNTVLVVSRTSVFSDYNHSLSVILQKTVFSNGCSHICGFEPLVVITKGSVSQGCTQVYSREMLLVPTAIPSYSPGLTCSLIRVEYYVQVNNYAKPKLQTIDVYVYIAIWSLISPISVPRNYHISRLWVLHVIGLKIIEQLKCINIWMLIINRQPSDALVAVCSFPTK